MLRSDFPLQKNQLRAPSFLLFREKSRAVRLLVCKRTRDGSQSLPIFHDIAPSAQPKSPAATAFADKSCKNARTSQKPRRASRVRVFVLLRLFARGYDGALFANASYVGASYVSLAPTHFISQSARIFLLLASNCDPLRGAACGAPPCWRLITF